MKLKNIYKIGTLALVSVATLCSCNDFLTIYPTDKTVGENFWKTKDQVEQMVSGAYISMMDYSCQERAIIWGSYRSDEMDKREEYSNTNLDNISAANLMPSNGYNSWQSFYSVINRCNIILNHVNDVMESDPQFTQGDCDEVCAEMRALRALCYFYLVRAFRDVPYTTQSYENDEQNMMVAQSTPDSVLNHCIEDLEYAERYILHTGAYGRGDERNRGYITRDAVWAILADIYLWRASMTHSEADYRACVNYADKVIDSKDEYWRTNYGNAALATTDKYHLTRGSLAFGDIFVSSDGGNSLESILEWQYDGEYNSNKGVEQYYYREGESDATSRLMASRIFSTVGNASSDFVYLTTNDYRYWDNVYGVGSTTADQFSIRKFASTSNISYYLTKGTSTVGQNKVNGIMDFSKYNQNWIVYRLTDVMLMKAEALVQLASSDDDEETLRSAYNLVKVINDRSWIAPSQRYPTSSTIDSLTIGSYKTKANMELLVLAERERELCFEGKRWFDLVRYCYRHMDGVNINAKMADQSTWPSLNTNMLKLMTRKFESGGESVIYKMKNEPWLYFPILLSEIKVNSLLKQNPVYEEEETISKN